MQYPQNYVDSCQLRTEIAILQEDVNASNPGICKFTIPAIIVNTNKNTIYTPMHNIANKKLLKSTIARTRFDDTIDIKLPKEYTAYAGVDIIPKGTRFVVAFIGGNLNDIRIIGRYDYLEG